MLKHSAFDALSWVFLPIDGEESVSVVDIRKTVMAFTVIGHLLNSFLCSF